MKTLTVRQPWASLIMSGDKTLENRNWSTPYRGRLAIHSALALAPFVERAQVNTMAELGLCPPVDLATAPRGVVLGTVQLVDIKIGLDSIWTNDSTYQWILQDPQLFASPIPAPGRLGLWEWEE